MNGFIAGVVGGVMSFAAMVGGVNALQGDTAPVSQQDLYTYADE